MCNDIVFHFNKKHLENPKIPMWVIKYKGETFYVHHVNVAAGIGFSTKETPDNNATKGSLKFKGVVSIINENGQQIATIKNNTDIPENPHTSLKMLYIYIKTNMSKKLTKKKFVEQARQVHGEKYDYSLVDYVDVDTNVIINCPIHGNFLQTPYTHKTGSGCKKCRSEKLSLKFRDDINSFILKANKIHNNNYDYSLVKYTNQMTKVEIICKNHGNFMQMPYSHLNGKGCPVCKESKGEKLIRDFLNKHNILFIPQYKFDDCMNKRKLPFDFYLPDYNVCIEFQGKQHFSIKYGGFGASQETALCNLTKLQINDNIKKQYCSNKGIELLTISYNENINEILSIKFKGILHLSNEDDIIIANISNT